MCAVSADLCNIALVGPRAAGKTTLAELLAVRLERTLVDTDAFLVEREGRSVSRIVEEEGWSGFRQRESNALEDVLRQFSRNAVIATGGGLVLAKKNRELLRTHCVVFYLSAPAEELARRMAAQALHAQRPSLTGKHPLDEVETVLTERHTLYMQSAHYVLDATLEPEELCVQIAALLLNAAP